MVSNYWPVSDLLKRYMMPDGRRAVPYTEICDSIVARIANYSQEVGDADPDRHRILNRLAAQCFAVLRGEKDSIMPVVGHEKESMKFLMSIIDTIGGDLMLDINSASAYIEAGAAQKKDLIKIRKELERVRDGLKVVAQGCEAKLIKSREGERRVKTDMHALYTA